MTSSLYITHCDKLHITNYDCATSNGYLAFKNGCAVIVTKTTAHVEQVAMCQHNTDILRITPQNIQKLCMGIHTVCEW
jgi:hypothetical protein